MTALHLAILLFGAAGLLGRALPLDPLAITAGRAGVAGFVLWTLVLRSRRRDSRLPLPGWGWVAGAGALLALHWSCFFDAVQQGGVPLALLSYASFPAFSLLLERLAHRDPSAPVVTTTISLTRQLTLLTLLIVGLLVLAGPGVISSAGRLRGLGMGLAAGASFAGLTRLNAARLERHGPLALAAAQMTGAALWLLPVSAGALWSTPARSWLLLLALGLACTALAHTLFIRALCRVTPFQAGLAAGLEPVYGVLLAALLPGAAPRAHEWAALPLIVAAALLALPGRGTTTKAPRAPREE